ncbi:hypothetical protein PSACC_01734 [Paramicrosporidium saccamoebae]|uniref:Uncharacterized protein n=1 Tax=Paramicrosporidium saccamoebae TaxID=1246581 RepID=A0A2H9TL22_9FUNG|nr:hypothetical protein PSACC_01734 [Paramicrosporidium saccamoebae]
MRFFWLILLARSVQPTSPASWVKYTLTQERWPENSQRFNDLDLEDRVFAIAPIEKYVRPVPTAPIRHGSELSFRKSKPLSGGYSAPLMSDKPAYSRFRSAKILICRFAIVSNHGPLMPSLTVPKHLARVELISVVRIYYSALPYQRTPMNLLWFLVFAKSIKSTLPDGWSEYTLTQDGWLNDLVPYEGILINDAYVEDEFSCLEAVNEHDVSVSNYPTFQDNARPACEQQPPADCFAPLMDETSLSLPKQWQEGNEPRAVLSAEPTITDPLSIKFAPYQPLDSLSKATFAKPAERAIWFPDDGELFADSQISTWETKSSTMLSQYHYLGVIKPEKYYSQMLGSNTAMGYRMTQDRIIVLDGYSVTNPMGENLFSTWATNTLIPNGRTAERAVNLPPTSPQSETPQPDSVSNDLFFGRLQSSSQTESQEKNKRPSTEATHREKEKSSGTVSLQLPRLSNETPPTNSAERAIWFSSACDPYAFSQASIRDKQSSAVFSHRYYQGAVKPLERRISIDGRNSVMGYRIAQDRILLLDGYRAKNPNRRNPEANKSFCIVATISTKQIPQSKKTKAKPRSSPRSRGKKLKDTIGPSPSGSVSENAQTDLLPNDLFFERLQSSSQADGQEKSKHHLRADTAHQEMAKSSGPVPRQSPAPSSTKSPTEPAERAIWFRHLHKHYTRFQESTRNSQSSAVFDKRYYYGVVGFDASSSQIYGRNGSMGYRCDHTSSIPFLTNVRPFQADSQEESKVLTGIYTTHQEISNSSGLITHQPPSPSSVAPLSKSAESAFWFLESSIHCNGSQSSIQDTQSPTVFSHRYYKGAVKLEKYPFHMTGSNAAMGYQVTQDRILVSNGYHANSPTRESIFTWGTNALSEATMGIEEFCKNSQPTIQTGDHISSSTAGESIDKLIGIPQSNGEFMSLPPALNVFQLRDSPNTLMEKPMRPSKNLPRHYSTSQLRLDLLSELELENKEDTSLSSQVKGAMDHTYRHVP